MSPARRKAKEGARRKPAKKTARRKGTKTSARRKPARKARVAAKRRTKPKRATAARSAMRPRAATKRSAMKIVARSGRKRVTRKATTRRPKLAVIRPPKAAKRPVKVAAAPPEPQAFAAAKASASAKDLVLFELVRARVAVHAAIQGMSAASAERPTEPGKWTTREMILHLAYWDREMLPALEDAFQHDRMPGLTHDDVQERNPVGVEELRHHDWESAKRLLQLHREKLLEGFQSIPEEPAAVWSREHAVGRLARLLTRHDLHHADKLKAARTSAGE